MYTATALSRAAAIAAASAAIVATQQQQQHHHIPEVDGILESDEPSSSVFSRLDQVADQPVRVAVDTSKPRTIKLSKESKSGRIKVTARQSTGAGSASKVTGLRSVSQPINSKQRMGKKAELQRGVVKSQATPRSMVADEFDFQLKRQQDVRSRLESKEKAKMSRRQGPLAGRLAKHNVFGRLE